MAVAKTQLTSCSVLPEPAVHTLMMGSEAFQGPFQSSLEVEDAAGLIAIFNGDSMKLLNLYQTVSVRASAVLEIGAVPENTVVVFAVHYTEGMAAHSRSRLASTILAELSI